MPISLIQKRITAFIVSFAMFMESLDSNIVNTAIPAMAQSLNENPLDLKITLISYLLGLAVFIPISGWVADKYGAKRIFIIGLSLFTLSSLWCGFSHHLLELMIARTLQGLGGSFALPVGRLIIVRFFPKHELSAAMGQVVMVATVGMMLGPVLGGFITHYFSWRWIFFINIPVGIIAVIIAHRYLIETPKQAVFKLDILGFVLFGLSLAAFTFGLSAFSETYLSDFSALLIMCIGLISLLAYILHSHNKAHPIVNPALFQIHTFRVASVGNIVARFGVGAIPFLMPLLLQLALGYPAQISGLMLAPMAAGILLIKPFITPLLRRFGYRHLLIVNTALTTLALCGFTILNIHTSMVVICVLTFIFGILLSTQNTSMNTLAYANIPEEYYSNATSVMSTLQQLAPAFGVAVGALLLRIFSPSSDHHFLLTPSAFHKTFLAMGGIAFLSLFTFLHLTPEDGKELLEKKSA